MSLYYDIPHLQIRHNAILFYNQPSVRPPSKKVNFVKSYSGKVTNPVAKRIQKAVDILIQKSPPVSIYNPIINKTHDFTIGFVTLTISDNTKITGKEAHKKLLRPFIRRMKVHGDFDYIWKAEFQKRGQLHYHITWNKWIDYRDIKKEWNKLQRRAGLLDKFGQKFKHYNPNSTDVHSVYKVKDIAAYLSKYLSKSNSQVLDGKTWDCSRSLKIKRFSFVMENFNDNYLRYGVDKGEIEMLEFDRCTVFKTSNPLDVLTNNQRLKYLNWKK